MYGMLLESVQHYLQLEYGDDAWAAFLSGAGCPNTVYSTHQEYADSTMRALARAAADAVRDGLVPLRLLPQNGQSDWSDTPSEIMSHRLVLAATSQIYKYQNTLVGRFKFNAGMGRWPVTEDDFMTFFGRCFVRFFSNFGYDDLIRAAGRHFCDFLGGVDNIHQQIRFSYPKMKSPSMFLAERDADGAVLVYRSKRQGFLPYFIGQLQQIAETFFHTPLQIKVVSVLEWDENDATEVEHRTEARLRLDFDNRAYMASRSNLEGLRSSADRRMPPVHAGLLMDLFPFGALLQSAPDGSALVLQQAGEKLLDVLALQDGGRCLHGAVASEFFRIRRPQGALFTMDSIRQLQSVLFEVEVLNVKDKQADRASTTSACILLKGQMLYLEDTKCIVFLCSPLVSDLSELAAQGLFLNDLNLHGLSREMVMEGWHQCARLELMCERAEQHSTQLQDSLRLLDQWRRRGDELLCSMIPRTVADRLLDGTGASSALDTCQAFDAVTVLFCELLDVDRGEQADTAEVVAEKVKTINQAFSQFDHLLDDHHVYKVETVGQVYMVVSGAPEPHRDHAVHACRVALGLQRCARSLRQPVRIGLHSGPVVAGVVGLKVPRYCLFGDTVNTAARMQSSSLSGSVQLSAATQSLLKGEEFRTMPRGQVWVKGKGLMSTFWLLHGEEEAGVESEDE
ncbi:soluble guanylate cyclase 89Db-like [Thrips palmi]|uniref:guanylate cyclase n=1 Tax=Thrips palmi TaxID=161013 RepID=A0A6P8ZPZ7_THRPL|nr:soluble guanylate cyclase 89Db-like [Thrips palmi]